MRNQRSFNSEFKRQVVEELISGESRAAQACRWYDIAASLLHHHVQTGFVCLAAILDAYSRTVVGYEVATSIDTALTHETLKMAIARRQPDPGVIHDSDQGVQYASRQYVDELKRHGFIIGVARTGSPYENAMMESFFNTLKHEELNLCEYETYQDVAIRPPCFLEKVYNQERLHSALGYRPPDES